MMNILYSSLEILQRELQSKVSILEEYGICSAWGAVHCIGIISGTGTIMYQVWSTVSGIHGREMTRNAFDINNIYMINSV